MKYFKLIQTLLVACGDDISLTFKVEIYRSLHSRKFTAHVWTRKTFDLQPLDDTLKTSSEEIICGADWLFSKKLESFSASSNKEAIEWVSKTLKQEIDKKGWA